MFQKLPSVRQTVNSTSNSSGTIEVSGINNTFSNASLSPAINLIFDGATNSLSGFPVGANITVTQGSNSTVYPAGAVIPYASGATISVAGLQFEVSGSLTDGDTFTLSQNTANASGGQQKWPETRRVTC